MSRISPEQDFRDIKVSQISDLPDQFREANERIDKRHSLKVTLPAFVLGVAVGALAYFATGSVAIGIAAGSFATPATIWGVEHLNIE